MDLKEVLARARKAQQQQQPTFVSGDAQPGKLVQQVEPPDPPPTDP